MKEFFYRVNEKDTVFSISDRFNVPPLLIVKDNGLAEEIREGDVLFIRKTSGRIYTANPFDTVNGVAEKFGVTPEMLKEINGTDYFFYGLKILIPD